MADTATQTTDAEARIEEQNPTTQEVLVEEVSIDGMCGVY